MNVASLRSNTDANAQSAEIKIAKVALMNISLWVAMWTPYAAIVLQGAVGNQDKITPLVTILPALIAKSASIANPIVYAISHPKYRLVRTVAKLMNLAQSGYRILFDCGRLFRRSSRGSASTNQNLRRATTRPSTQFRRPQRKMLERHASLSCLNYVLL